jgi:hypothetical protein
MRVASAQQSVEHRYGARETVDAHADTVCDPDGGVAGADDTGDAVLAGDDRGVRQNPSGGSGCICP